MIGRGGALALAACAVASSVGCGGRAPRTPPAADDLQLGVLFTDDAPASIGDRMEHHGVPGAAVALIRDFRVVWVRTWGVADRETGAPVRPTTLFQAASVSKPVAAAAALRLVEQGKLALASDVNDALASWELPPSKFTVDKPVTLTHLLSHTGGLTVHGFPGYPRGEVLPSLRQVLDGTEPANTAAIRVDTRPGTLWRYSGGGYTVLQQLILDATGRSFPDAMDALVLEPAGMSASTFAQPLPADRLRDAASGVLPDGDAVEGGHHVYPEMAAAGLWTTAGDLARFVSLVQCAAAGRTSVLSPVLAARMLEPVDPGFGRGFELSELRGEPYFGHGGWNEGFCSQVTAHRTAGHGVVVLINANQPELIQEVVRAVAQQEGWPAYAPYERQPIPSDALERWPGRYRYSAEMELEVSASDGRLFLTYDGSEPQELFHVGDGIFVRRERPAPIRFSRDKDGVHLHFLLPSGPRKSIPRLD